MNNILQRIAKTLRVPTSAFFAGDDTFVDEASLLELVRLWSAIRQADDRERVLALARSLAGSERVPEKAAE